MNQITVGIIGCNMLVGDMLMQCLAPLNVRVVGISGDEGAASKIMHSFVCGTYYADYHDLLAAEKPQLVLIFPDDPFAEFDIVKDCLKAGAYAFAGHPVCTTVAQAEEIIQLQKETGCYVMPRYNRRGAPSYQMAREIIQRPEFGKCDMFLASYYAAPYISEKRMLLSHFSHLIDALIYLLGDMQLLSSDKIVKDDKRICYNMTFLTESGAIGTLQSGFTLCYENPMERVVVTGDGRSLLLENIRSLTYYRPAPERKYGGKMILSDQTDALKWEQNYGQMTMFSYYGFEGCLEELVHAIEEKRAPDFHMEDGIKTLRLLEEIERRTVQRG